MLKLLVTELPKTARDCPFSIKPNDTALPCNCKLMMNDSDDWGNMQFTDSYGHYSCVLDRRMVNPCPFLMTMNQYNWVKKR